MSDRYETPSWDDEPQELGSANRLADGEPDEESADPAYTTEEADLDAEAYPIPASHIAELRRRVNASIARPDEGFSWEDVKADIEKEL